MRPTFLRHPEHRFTSLLAFDSVKAGEENISLLLVPVARPARSGDLEEPDLRIFSAENLWTEVPPGRPAEEEVEEEDEVIGLEEEEEEEEEAEEEVALKHFWHMLLVAGLPVRPQLLMQRVKASGTLNSVSSFSVL